MFTKRHEQEIAEIKGLAYELGARLDEIVKQLERIREVQDRLVRERATADQLPVTHDPALAEPTPSAAAKAKRKAARAKAPQAADGKARPKDGSARASRRQGKPALKRRRDAGRAETAPSLPAEGE